MRRRGRFLSFLTFLVVLPAVFFLGACSSPDWQVRVFPTADAVSAALADTPNLTDLGELDIQGFPKAKMPKSVRPCCAFGNAQKVIVGPIPVPFFRYANTIEVGQIGPHSYEAGTYSFQKMSPVGPRGSENNGQLYTLHGGFIDLAHVRDTTDNTVALFYKIYQKLGREGRIELPREIGLRYIQLSAFDTDHLDALQRWELAAAMAARLAYFMAEAHEIAQWHGYRSWALWSEEVSAYSPEDLYSNMLGAKIAQALLSNNLAMNRELYNQHMNYWLKKTMEWLQPVSKVETNALFDLLDGLWWDSHEPLPSKFMLLKRHYELGDRQVPDLVPLQLISQHLGDKYPEANKTAEQPQAKSLSLARRVHGIDIDSVAQQWLFVDEEFVDSFTHIPKALWKNGFTSQDFNRLSSYNRIQDESQLKAKNTGKEL